MNAPREPSSSPTDLELARRASTRAHGLRPPVGEAFDVGYTRLPVRSNLGGATHPLPAPMPAAHQQADGPLPASPPLDSAWDLILGWCMQVASATGVFLMSAEGLAIAHVGAEDEVPDSAGSRLVLAHEHGRRIFGEGDTPDGVEGTLHFEKDGVWVTGMRIPTENVGSLTLGLVSTAPPTARVQERVRAVLSEQVEAQRERS